MAETAAGTDVVLVATHALEKGRREALIRDFYGRICMRLELEPARRGDLRMDASTTMLAGMSATRGTVAPMSWSRTAALMDDGNDDLVVSWMAGGYRIGQPNRREVTTPPGAACILPMDRAWHARTMDGSWTTCVQFPRALISARVRNLDDIALDAIHPQRPESRLLFDYVAAIAGRPVGPALGQMASRHILDLLAVAIGATPDAHRHATRRGVRAAQLCALQRHVEAHLTDPRLSAESAARSLHLSPRYIRRLLEGEHTTFSDYVAGLRLEWVHRNLCLPCHTGTPVADLAFEAGWAEPSTFYRRFKARYGVTPGEVRMQAATCATPPR